MGTRTSDTETPRCTSSLKANTAEAERDRARLGRKIEKAAPGAGGAMGRAFLGAHRRAASGSLGRRRVRETVALLIFKEMSSTLH